MTATKDEFRKMYRSLPMCMVGDVMADSATTVEELIAAVEIEIDLTREGQDGTSRRNLKPLLNWLAKHAKK